MEKERQECIATKQELKVTKEKLHQAEETIRELKMSKQHVEEKKFDTESERKESKAIEKIEALSARLFKMVEKQEAERELQLDDKITLKDASLKTMIEHVLDKSVQIQSQLAKLKENQYLQMADLKLE